MCGKPSALRDDTRMGKVDSSRKVVTWATVQRLLALITALRR
jgi:hypothetical protein